MFSLLEIDPDFFFLVQDTSSYNLPIRLIISVSRPFASIPTQVGNRIKGLCTDHLFLSSYLPTAENLNFLSILVL